MVDMMSSIVKTQEHPWHLRLLRWIAIAFVTLLAIMILAICNNNYSLHRISRAAFYSRLDRAIETSTQWMLANPEIQANQAMMFMVADMERMSGDSRLRQMLDQYRQSRYVANPTYPLTCVWPRIVDPHAYVPMIDQTNAPDQEVDEDRWQAFALAPDRVRISPAQKANLFSPTKYYWGRRQHQLFALDMYRYYNGGSRELNQTINHLAEKVARDAHFDFRVNDAYVQRSAFVLGANRPDLIRSRWIERILDYQRQDGSWAYCWYGWCRGILEIGFHTGTTGHATVQAAWALYMMKYRYPPWVGKHYH
jgi:hypothetical protein